MIADILVFIFGSIVGSFLNVCIHRMPLEESVVWPSSHCPLCKKKIPAYDNIPFISYILLKGRCRFCHKRIPLRYPFVELLSGVSFVLFFRHFGLTYEFFVFVLFLSALIIATFVDLKHRIIPDEVSVGGMIIGFILISIRGVTLSPLGFDYRPMLDSFLGIVIGGGIIYLTSVIFDLVYFKLLKKPPVQGETESMGGGDIKLLSMIGAFLGWERAVLTFFLAPFMGGTFGIVNLIVKKDRTVPYGPFLAFAAIISMFWAEKIIRFVLSL